MSEFRIRYMSYGKSNYQAIKAFEMYVRDHLGEKIVIERCDVKEIEDLKIELSTANDRINELLDILESEGNGLAEELKEKWGIL